MRLKCTIFNIQFYLRTRSGSYIASFRVFLNMRKLLLNQMSLPLEPVLGLCCSTKESIVDLQTSKMNTFNFSSVCIPHWCLLVQQFCVDGPLTQPRLHYSDYSSSPCLFLDYFALDCMSRVKRGRKPWIGIHFQRPVSSLPRILTPSSQNH